MNEPRYTVSFRDNGAGGTTFLRVSIPSQRVAGLENATSPEDALRRLVEYYPKAYNKPQRFAVSDGTTGTIHLFDYEPPKTVPAIIQKAAI